MGVEGGCAEGGRKGGEGGGGVGWGGNREAAKIWYKGKGCGERGGAGWGGGEGKESGRQEVGGRR